jgi:hypothetical protein
MVKAFVLIAVLVALFCVCPTAAQSQGPPPRPTIRSNPPQIQTRNKQQITESDKRGTEQSPLIVKTINPPKTKNEIEEERKEHEEKAAIDRSLVRYTGLLVVFTAVLAGFTLVLAGVAFWQGYHLRRSVDSLITSERAYVYATIEPDRDFDMWKIKLKNKELYDLSALLYLHNLGKTPAIIKEIAYGGDKFPKSPTIKDLSKCHIHNPIVTFIGGNEKVREDQFVFSINESELNTIRTTKPDITFYCFGYIRYKTIFGEERRHGFCLEFIPVFGKFAVTQESELNYDA